MSTEISQISPGFFRLSVFVPDFGIQFNHFLVVDEEPLLYHTGMRGMFRDLSAAVARILDPKRIRWIGFSHFESDECGAMNDWLRIAPHAQPVAGAIGAAVNLRDFSERPARVLAPGERLATGSHRFRVIPTPHLPHGWDATMLFEESTGTLFSSDLFHQTGACEPVANGGIVDRAREALLETQRGPFADYVPWTPRTERLLHDLATLEPRTIAVMHGSSFSGDGARALRDLAVVYREALS